MTAHGQAPPSPEMLERAREWLDENSSLWSVESLARLRDDVRMLLNHVRFALVPAVYREERDEARAQLAKFQRDVSDFTTSGINDLNRYREEGEEARAQLRAAREALHVASGFIRGLRMLTTKDEVWDFVKSNYPVAVHEDINAALRDERREGGGGDAE